MGPRKKGHGKKDKIHFQIKCNYTIAIIGITNWYISY